MSDKSILEQALLQVQNLEEAVKANAKGILASTMKPELTDLLKESMEEEMPVDEEMVDEPLNEQPDSEEEEENDVPVETGDDEDLDNETMDEPMDDEPFKGIDGMDADDMGDDEGMEDDDVVDMTGASDDEVLKVFKAMSDEDGIIVKKDGDDIELKDGDDEYIIKLDDEDMEDLNEEEDELPEPMAEEDDMGDEDLEEETVYEIELGDEDLNELDLDEPMPEDDSEVAEPDEDPADAEQLDADALGQAVADELGISGEGDVAEASRTMANDVRGGARQGKKYQAGRPELNEEVEKLRKQNDEYKKALVLFKDKLNEVAVFNANLAYATRLFTEHSTTKTEKLNILKRFDNVSTLNESKSLYSSIKSELETKTPISESVVGKITSTPSSSSSKEVLSEAKAYENPQFKRMKEIMSKIN